jgi:hypothetical protein
MPLRSRQRREEDTLVLDDRAFDAAVLRGVLTLYNELVSDISSRQDFSFVLDRAFGWLPEVLSKRAERAGVGLDNVRWSNAMTKEQTIKAEMKAVVDVTQMLLHTVGALGKRNSPLLFNNAPLVAGKKRPTPEQWVNKVLKALPIYSRFLFEDGEFKLVSVPLLTNYGRCVAYALALLWTDRHGFRDRVRACELLMDDKPSSRAYHYFLADDARQRFCCSAHSNTYRQRQLRRRQKEDAT